MQEKKDDINFEEVLDNEIDDIWDIFFPYMSEKKEAVSATIGNSEKSKPRRYLRFLSM